MMTTEVQIGSDFQRLLIFSRSASSERSAERKKARTAVPQLQLASECLICITILFMPSRQHCSRSSGGQQN